MTTGLETIRYYNDLVNLFPGREQINNCYIPITDIDVEHINLEWCIRKKLIETIESFEKGSNLRNRFRNSAIGVGIISQLAIDPHNHQTILKIPKYIEILSENYDNSFKLMNEKQENLQEYLQNEVKRMNININQYIKKIENITISLGILRTNNDDNQKKYDKMNSNIEFVIHNKYIDMFEKFNIKYDKLSVKCDNDIIIKLMNKKYDILRKDIIKNNEDMITQQILLNNISQKIVELTKKYNNMFMIMMIIICILIVIFMIIIGFIIIKNYNHNIKYEYNLKPEYLLEKL